MVQLIGGDTIVWRMSMDYRVLRGTVCLPFVAVVHGIPWSKPEILNDVDFGSPRCVRKQNRRPDAFGRDSIS